MKNNTTKSKGNWSGILKYHLHVLLYTYFWLGLFVGGLVAPQDRIAMLESSIITQGWHLSALSLILVLPIPIAYFFRMRKKN